MLKRRPFRSIGDKQRVLQDNLVALADYETSPMRWAFDALLVEFAALRAEIVLVKEQMERTYVFLLTLLAAIIGSQFIESVGTRLGHHPSIYLVSALVAMWLPVNNFALSIDMIALGKYLRDVTAVRLNAISEAASGAASRHYEVSIDMLLGWPTGNARGGRELSSLAAGPVNWEEFIRFVKPGSGSWQRSLVITMQFMRVGFLYSPTLVLIGFFFANARHVYGYEVALVILVAVLLVCLLVASFSVGNISSFNARRGPYRTDKRARP